MLAAAVRHRVVVAAAIRAAAPRTHTLVLPALAQIRVPVAYQYSTTAYLRSGDKAKAEDAQKTEEAPKTEADTSAPKQAPGRWYHMMEGIKDVLSVTFGVERKRNLSAEYDMGLREYPWIEYMDPSTNAHAYKNLDTGVVTDKKPLDFDKRASPSARVATNTEQSALSVVAPKVTPWERTLEAVTNAPIISSMLSVGAAVAASAPVQKVKEKVANKIEDAREVWETSQHPYVNTIARLSYGIILACLIYYTGAG